MATTYQRSQVYIQSSEQSDYSSPTFKATLEASTTAATDADIAQLSATATAGTATVDLTAFSGINELYVQNKGTVSVSFEWNDSSGNANVQTIVAGQWTKVLDVDETIDISLTTAAVDAPVKIIVVYGV